jgi:nucleotide-binding universal stress UspA family protein
MRLPIRSETEAMRLVFAGGAVIAISVLLGWLTTPLIGVAFFVVAVVLGAIAYVRAPNPEHRTPFADAEDEPHRHGGAPGERHVLVVANEALSGEELRQRLAEMGDRLELDVLAPVLTSRLHYVVSDIDNELAEARKRLDRSIAWARQNGFVARGEVGDPNPTTAIEDELRDFGADAVVVVTHRRELETWQEQGELERLRRELRVPVEHVMVGDGSGED